MINSNILIATSDGRENWGTVISEAMNEACVVVANEKIGAVPVLIKNGQTGISYKTYKEFEKSIKLLINNKSTF